jgi:cell division protease FtsH
VKSSTSNSDASAHAIEAAIKAILDRAFDRARAILVFNRPVLENAARQLLEHETLDEAQLNRSFADVRAPSPLVSQRGAA